MIPRSKLIELSLRCLGLGTAACIPIIGILFAPLALSRFRTVIVETNERWNPARGRLYAGAALALLSLLVHAILAVVVYIRVVHHYYDA